MEAGTVITTARASQPTASSVLLICSREDRPAATLDFKITYHDGSSVISDAQSFDLEGCRLALVSDYTSYLFKLALS
jgi:hypothetical protein